MPRGPFSMHENTMTREYAMYVDGRFVSQAVGEQEYIPNNPNMTYATASEGVRSNAVMRCCKDIGVASELWDPVFIHAWKAKHAVEVTVNGRKKWRRKDREPFWGEAGAPPKKAETPPQREQTEPLVVPDEAPVEGSGEKTLPENGDLKKITARILSVSEKTGGTGDKAWTRYGIKVEWPDAPEGFRWLNTFSATLGAVAKEMKGKVASMVYTIGDYQGKPQYNLDSFER